MKCYGTLVKTLINGRKIPCIPPLFHDNKFVVEFKEKSKILHSFFAKQCLFIDNGSKKGIFLEIWQQTWNINGKPVHKTKDKTLIKNYRPISLLPIFGKIFERVICNSLFNHFLRNKLFTPSQSSFLPGDSCMEQLLSIIHGI